MAGAIFAYPMIEQGIRAHYGRTIPEHLKAMGELFAGFAAVAAANPLADRRNGFSAEEIATVSASNPYIGFPYTKLMNSNAFIDQAAALIMTSVGKAKALELMILAERAELPVEIQSWGPTLSQAANLHLMLANDRTAFCMSARPPSCPSSSRSVPVASETSAGSEMRAIMGCTYPLSVARSVTADFIHPAFSTTTRTLHAPSPTASTSVSR